LGYFGGQGRDPLGLDDVVISGGINTDLKADPSHDANWDNFIASAKLKISELLNDLKKDEFVEWHVQSTSYQARALADNQPKDFYIDKIKELYSSLNKNNNVKLIWFKDEEEFYKNLNLNSLGKEREGSELISSLTLYGHGTANNVWLKFMEPDNYVNSDEIRAGKIEKKIFNQKVRAESWACNTSTLAKNGDSDKLDSFGTAWFEQFGFGIKGVVGKTQYRIGYKFKGTVRSEKFPVPSVDENGMKGVVGTRGVDLGLYDSTTIEIEIIKGTKDGKNINKK